MAAGRNLLSGRRPRIHGRRYALSLVQPTSVSKSKSAPRAQAEAASSSEHATFKGRWLPWLFLLPTLIVLAVFSYYPAARTLRLSVFRANIIIGNEQFVGLQNFAELLGSPVYHQVILPSRERYGCFCSTPRSGRSTAC